MNKALLKVAAVVVVLVIAAVVWVDNTLDRGAKAIIEDLGPKVTGTLVTVGSVNLSAFSGKGMVENLLIANPDGFTARPAIKSGQAQIKMEPMTILSGPIVINEVVADRTELLFETSDEGSNLDRLLKNVETIPSQSQATGGPMVIVERFVVNGGVVQVEGRAEPIQLPEIALAGIGQEGGGVTTIEARAQVLRHVIKTAIDTLNERGIAARR